MSKLIGVLTGDIINSTEIPPERVAVLFSELEAAADEVSAWQNAPTHFTRNRGDGWQLCLIDPKFSLRASLFVRAKLKSRGRKLDTRISVAVGIGDVGVSGNLNAAHGEVFVNAVRGLDVLNPRITLNFFGNVSLAAVFCLADHITRGWTEAQARAIAPMLAPERPVRRAVAKKIGVSRQAVDQALASAGYPALERSLDLFERVSFIDPRTGSAVRGIG